MIYGPFMLRRIFIYILFTQSLAFGCESRNTSADSSEVPGNASLTVFAAASLAQAFTEIARSFERASPGVTVYLNFAGSQQLAQQIARGAPADVFASANRLQMQAAVASNRIEEGSLTHFARNGLAVISPVHTSNAFQSIHDLVTPGLRIILADEAVPAGHYTGLFLSNASQSIAPTYESDVRKNVVSYELNVRAVLTKIMLEEADAGIVYESDLQGATNIQHIVIPDSLNPQAIFPIAPLRDSTQPELASRFIQYVQSPEGKTILRSHGFEVADSTIDP